MAEYPRPALASQILLTLFLATIVSYMDRGIISLLVPDLKTAFSLSDTQISIVQGLSFSAFFALGSIPVGHLVDRFSRRNILIFGICFWSAATITCGLAQSYTQLLAARACVGLGEASLIPAAYSMVADCFKSEQRGRAMSLLVAGASLGGALSNLIGGMLLHLMSGRTQVMVPVLGQIEVWRFILVVFGSFGAVLVLALFAFKEPPRITPSSAASKPEQGTLSFFAYARRDPALYAVTFIIVAMIFTTTTVTSLWVVVALARVHDVSMANSGILVGVTKLAAHVVGSLGGGVVGDMLARRDLRYGRLNMWMLGIPLLAVGGLLLVWPANVTAFIIGFWLIGIVGAAVAGAAYPIIYDVVPAALRGQSVGYCITIANLLSFGLGPTLPALLNDRFFRDEGMIHYSLMIVTVGAGLTAAVLAVLIRNRFERAKAELEGALAIAGFAPDNRMQRMTGS